MTNMTIEETLKERGNRYGEFMEHARITQNIKREIFGPLKERGVPLQPDQVEALEMIAHKLGRIANGDPNYADSWRDIGGYSELVTQRLERDEAASKATQTREVC